GCCKLRARILRNWTDLSLCEGVLLAPERDQPPRARDHRGLPAACLHERGVRRQRPSAPPPLRSSSPASPSRRFQAGAGSCSRRAVLIQAPPPHGRDGRTARRLRSIRCPGAPRISTILIGLASSHNCVDRGGRSVSLGLPAGTSPDGERP